MSEQRALAIEDDEGRTLHLTWSRSGKRLVLTATMPRHDPRQVELRPEQVEELIDFLRETLAERTSSP